MVMDYIGIILLACFVVIVIIGPVSCIVLARRREHQKYHPTPRAFQRARRKLSSVTECRKQGEKCAEGEGEWIGDCPICMGPLCPVASHHGDDPTVNAAKTEGRTAAATASWTKSEVVSNAEVDARRPVGAEDETIAGPATSRHDPAAPEPAASKEAETAPHVASGGDSVDADHDHKSRERAKNAAAPATPTDRDLEILKLKPCGHSFHSRCLSSWFLIERYDCPVCRTLYWLEARQKSLFGGLPQTGYSMTSARMAMGAVV